MVRVSGDLRLVTDRPALVSQVRVRAAHDRAERGGLTTTFDDVVPVSNGRVEMNVLPGPAVMVLEESGGFSHVVKLLVLGHDSTLEECVKAAGDADEYSKRELEQMVLEVREYYPMFGEVAKDALMSASEAGTYASSAATSAQDAKSAESRVTTLASNAATSARNAKTSESNASEHASEAARHEVAAKGHAEDAEDSASAAKSDAERAATIAGSTRWVGTQVEVNGKMSPNLMPVLEVSERGTWVINGVDTGVQARGPGGASSWEDIAEKPAVFPPAEHKHTSSQVTDAVNDAGAKQFGGKLVKGRDSDGKIFYYSAPTEGRELANKEYVDGAVSGAASKSDLASLESRVDLRPALFSGWGPPPASIPGARVGDYWLNKSTMELHEIKGI